MTFKNFSEVQLNDAWGEYATQWRNAILAHPMATPYGLNSQTDVEELLTGIFSKLIEKNIRRFAFNVKSPDEFTLDDKVWASISPARTNKHYTGKGLLI